MISMYSFLRLYFLVLSYLIGSIVFRLQEVDFTAVSYAQFAVPLFFLSKSAWIGLGSLCVGMMMVGFFFFPERKEVRFLACFSALAFFSLTNSFGKVNHDGHTWMAASILICFLDANQNLFVQRNLFVVRLIQYFMLSTYFTSGVWKVRSLLADEASFFDFLQDSAANSFGYAVGQGWKPEGWVLSFISEYPEVLGYGLLAVIMFQISCFLPVIRPKLLLWFGCMGLMFHVANAITLGIIFRSTMIGCAFFLIFFEWALRRSRLILPSSL